METDEEEEGDLEVTFTGVCVHAEDHVHILSIVDEYAEDRQDHALVFSRIGDEWSHRPIENSVAGLCVVEEPKPKVLNLGIDGEVQVFTLPGFETESIAAGSEGPDYSSHLKCIRKIGDQAYAAGMARQVHRREAGGRWHRIDESVYVPPGQRKKSVGFCSIDGLSEHEIYAVGYKGEIWLFDGRRWEQAESPTNVALTNVRCLDEKQVYACGMGGVLLKGRGSAWQIIEQDLTEEDFWGMAVFRNCLYVANYDGVFRLEKDELKAVDMRLRGEHTTAYLDACEDVLWSVGDKDLIFTTDGKKWKPTPSP